MIDESTLKAIHKQASEALMDYHIAEGLHGMSVLMQECADQQLARTLESIRLDYDGMMDFLSEGGTDEAHTRIQESLVQQALHVLDSISRAIRLQQGEDLYAQAYSRLFATYGPDITQALRLQWKAQQGMTERYETQDLLFDLLWTMPQWDSRQTAEWFEFLSRMDTLTQQHLLGGILLSTWEYFDKEKAILLQLMCESEHDGVRALAVTACVLLTLRYTKRIKLYPTLRLNLKQEDTTRAIRYLQRELILMKESPKVNKAINQELNRLNFQKMGPQLFHQELERIMRRYGNMFAMGIDMDLNKVTLLHSSRFLRSISHWWAPFDESRPIVQEFFIRKDGEIANGVRTMFERSTDCSVNRYALCEAMMNHVNLDNLDQQLMQFEQAQREQDEDEDDGESFTEEDKEKALRALRFRLCLRNIVHNIYRFFHHSPLAGKVENVFEMSLLLPDNEFLRPAFRRKHMLDLCHLLLQFQYNDDAFRYLQEIVEQQGATAELLRMMGQCRQNTHNLEQAVQYFSQADILEENDPWTLSQMEMCYVKMKRFDKLWEILTRFDVLYPDNPSVTRRMAGCLVMQGKHAEALNYLYKLELTDQNDPTTLSQIAVSSAHIGRFDTARKYILKRQQAKKPLTKEERLMAGSVYFAEGDWAQALSMLEQADLAAYDSYEPALASLGISIGDIRLMRDMIERGRKD